MPNEGPITFELSKAQQEALSTVAGRRRIRLGGRVIGGTVQVDFIACNAAFTACNAAFAACNAAFTACNAAFTACNAAFSKDK